MLVKDEINRTIDEIAKKVLYLKKLMCYNKIKIEIISDGEDVRMSEIPDRKVLK